MKLSRRHFVMGTSALALAAPATIARAQSDNIKFATILDLSGGLDIYGAPMAETTKLAIEDINAAGGLLGREVELDPLFPERVNAGFAQILDAGHIRLRVWERGAGLTAACGTGACAALVAAHRRGLCERRVTIHADGGDLRVAWREADDHVILTGPVEDEGPVSITL